MRPSTDGGWLLLLVASAAATGIRADDAHSACPGDGSRHLLMFHDRSEGSHGLIDSLDNLPCVHVLRQNRGEYLHLDPSVLTAYFRAPSDTWAEDVIGAIKAGNQSIGSIDGLQAEIESFVQEEKEQGCSCTSRGTLVRLDEMDGAPKSSTLPWKDSEVARSIQPLCKLFSPRHSTSPPVLPVILIRDDVMRWALSIYGRVSADEKPNQQFGSEPTIPVSKVYSIGTLSTAAKQNARLLDTKVMLLRALRSVCGVRPAVQTYETYEMADALVDGMADFLLPCFKGATDGRAALDVRTVVRVHSHDIKTFVENAEEVMAHFAMTHYPRFAEAMEKHGLTEEDLDDFSEVGKIAARCRG